jgi:hypothetical protein
MEDILVMIRMRVIGVGVEDCTSVGISSAPGSSLTQRASLKSSAKLPAFSVSSFSM